MRKSEPTIATWEEEEEKEPDIKKECALDPRWVAARGDLAKAGCAVCVRPQIEGVMGEMVGVDFPVWVESTMRHGKLRAIRMGQQVKVLANKPDDLGLTPEPPWWKERTAPESCVCAHIHGLRMSK